jgi:hypothetical protein
MYVLAEFVGDNPSNFLSENLCLIVNSLDREKTLSQTIGANDIVLKLCT